MRDGEPSAAGSQRLHVIVNTAAGRPGKRSVERIRAALADAAVPADVQPSSRPIEEAAREALEAGASVLGIAGGDGSARAAAQVLAGSESVLAIFPTGTLNHFSRGLGIDTVEAAARAVVRRHVASIAVGNVNGTLFLNTATFGLYADVLRRRERLRPFLGKWPAALVSFLVTIARYRPIHVALVLDGMELHRATALVRVGIGRDSFPTTSATAEERRAPELEIGILRAHTRAGLIALGFRTMLRIIELLPRAQDAGVEILRTRGFTLQSDSSRIGTTLDGEVIRSRGSLEVAVHDAALRVLVAEDATRSSRG